MEMHQIRYFLSLSRTLNFTKAADQCNVAQPSLTRAIKKLEEEFGGALFRRERSRTHLTELGRLMLPVLQQAYDSAVAAKQLAASFHSSECAPLSIALSYTIDTNMISPFLAELTRAIPGLEIQMTRGTPDQITEQLKDGIVELALAGPLSSSWDRLESWLLFVECFNVLVPKHHPLTTHETIAIHQLEGESVLSRSYCECSDTLGEVLAENNVEQNASHNIPSETDLIGLVSAGLGVAFVPASLPHHGTVQALRLDGIELNRSVNLFSVAGRQRSPASSALIKLLRATDWESRLHASV